MSKGQYLLCNGACQKLPDYLILRYLVSKQLKAYGPRLKQTHMLKLFMNWTVMLTSLTILWLGFITTNFLYVYDFIYLHVLIYLCVQKSNVTFWSLQLFIPPSLPSVQAICVCTTCVSWHLVTFCLLLPIWIIVYASLTQWEVAHLPTTTCSHMALGHKTSLCYSLEWSGGLGEIGRLKKKSGFLVCSINTCEKFQVVLSLNEIDQCNNLLYSCFHHQHHPKQHISLLSNQHDCFSGIFVVESQF